MQFDQQGHDRPPLPGAGYFEDYTVPFLVAAGVLCFLALFAVWSLFGLPGALIAAFLADRALIRR